MGVFDELQAPGFPAAQDRMTVVFVMEWDAGEAGRRSFRADLLDPDERKVLTIEGHTDVAPAAPGSRPRTQLIMPVERVVFPQAGEYRFVLSVEETVLPAFSLHLSKQA
jgi:acetylornithine deacetylase/succinyl-diaminopimelate desuccinylase-like protein